MEDLSEKQNGAAELQKEMAELARENDQLLSHLHQTQEEFEKYILACRKLEQESEERSRQVQELTEALQRAEKDVKAVREENAALQKKTDSRVQDLSQENDDLLRHLHHTQEEFEKYILKYRETEAKVQESAEGVGRLTLVLEQAEERLNMLREEKRQRAETDNVLKSCIADLEETISGLTFEHERMTYEYVTVKEAYEIDRVLLEKKSELESENASLQGELDAARTALDEHLAQADIKSMQEAEMQRMLEVQITELSETLARITMESEGMAFAMTKMEGLQ